MKVLLAADMEGITGVTSWEQVTPGQSEWQRFRRLMTQDVNAAVAGLFDAGATEVAVVDAHWKSNNILIENLDGRAVLQSGTPTPLSMLEGIQNGMDAAVFLGCHAMVGTANAVLDHTWSSNVVAGVTLNGKAVGEVGLNAALSGEFDVPVIMTSGDQTVAAEAADWIPGVKSVVVKEAKGRYAAACLSPEVTQNLLREGAKSALAGFAKGKMPKPVVVDKPVKICLSLRNTVMADRVQYFPGVTRIDGRDVAFESERMIDAYRLFRAVVALAG